MKEQFLPYELALKLKKLGFDQECLGFYTELENLVIKENVKNQDCSQDKCIAPIWQQAFDWFREEHDLLSFIRIGYRGYSDKLKTYDFSIVTELQQHEPLFIARSNNFRVCNYEQSRIECLEKLIELVELKKDSV